MLFNDPYQRVVVVPPGAQRGRSPLRLLLSIVIALAVFVHVFRTFRSSTERTSPAHVTHGHPHAANPERP
jgi:hypothetical protein